MIPFLIGFLTCLSTFFRSRYSLGLEILALRQQLGIMKRKVPRPQLRTQDRIFSILLRRLWPAWSLVLVIVKPETVVAWHRAGFRLFWRRRSQSQTLGRPKVNAEVRSLIRRMSVRTSAPILGLPRLFGRVRRRQNKRKPARCQATTVSGLTMTRTLLLAGQRRRSRIQIFDPGFSAEGEDAFA